MRELSQKELNDLERLRGFLRERGHAEPYWTTEEAEELFDFRSFIMGIAFVTRKADGKKGTMVWADGGAVLPDCYARLYFNFWEEQ